MGSNRPSERGRILPFILALLIAWTPFAWVYSSEAKRSPQDQYDSGMECQGRLIKSPKRKTFRHNWEACIRDFESLLRQNPDRKLTQNAIFKIAELYSGLYRYSSHSGDLEKAKRYYQDLISRYGSSSLARSAKKKLQILNKRYPSVSLNIITAIRHSANPDYTRLVLDLERGVRFDKTMISEDEISIILPGTRLGPDAESGRSMLNSGLLRRVTVQPASPDAVDVRISLEGLPRTPKITTLTTPDRLVIDIYGETPLTRINSPKPPVPSRVGKSGSRTQTIGMKPLSIKTIVIDPGHGGKDPGAIGKGGLTEKDVVLDIGLRLRTLIQKRLGKKVIMTRKDDRFISLDQRTSMANKKGADLYISIHVNSHPQRKTRGVEIYHFGRSSDRRAMAVAARENNVSIQSLGNLDKSVKQILLNLGQEYTRSQSQDLAYYIRESFKKTLQDRYKYKMVDHGVKRAPFYVLMHSGMPSILAEASFISNPTEEKLLRKSKYRQAIAESIYQGIRNYLASLQSVS